MPFKSRAVIAASAGVLSTALVGGPALAHVEVHADKTQAGAKDVTLTFTGEAESGSAGITSERVVLPAGIAPGDVTLAKAPAGWKFTTAADGFTIAGKALKVGQDADFAVKVAQLPTAASSLSFKTLETYSDGQVVRWIDLQQPGEAEPEHPAPTIMLRGAVKAAPSTASAAPSSEADAPPVVESSAPVGQAATADDSGSSHTGLWITVAVVVIVILGALLLWRSRKQSS